MSFGRTMFVRTLLLAACCASLVFGQNVTGTIEGIIKDASGAVVPNVTVTAINRRTASANSSRPPPLHGLPGGAVGSRSSTTALS